MNWILGLPRLLRYCQPSLADARGSELPSHDREIPAADRSLWSRLVVGTCGMNRKQSRDQRERFNMTNWLRQPTSVFLALILLPIATLSWGQKVNPSSQVIEDFESRVKDYLKLRKQVEGNLKHLKPTVSQEAIAHHEREMAERIRKARRGAIQGAIFSPEIAAEFHRLIGLAMQGSDAGHIQQSLRHAEPVRMQLRINASYPADAPLQSTPPTLLMNLPPLPPELDYRVVGNSLVLRDAKANLILDFIPNAIP
jgi:hypothetical protein